VADTDQPAGQAGEFLSALIQLRDEPQVIGLARRWAGDLWEDALQETFYAVSKVRSPDRITNLRAYFCRSLVHTAQRMREDLASGGVPVDDLGHYLGPPGSSGSLSGGMSPGPVDDEALERLGAEQRLDCLRHRARELAALIPACSADPSRYRQAVLTAAAWAAGGADRGPSHPKDLTDALRRIYPEWFDEPGASTANLYQRRSRGLDAVRAVLLAVIEDTGLAS
jgi:hypothetical protein